MRRRIVVAVGLAFTWGTGCSFLLDYSGVDDGAPAQCDAGICAEASARDSSSDSTTLSCTNSSYIVCDDFEEGLDSTRWVDTELGGTGNITVDSMRPYHGSQSLHARFDSGDGGASKALLGDYVSLPKEFYVRAYLFWPASSPNAEESFLFLTEGSPPYDGMALGIFGGKIELNDWATPPSTVTSSTAFPPAAWNCVVWHITGGTPGQLGVVQNGAVLSDLSVQAGTPSIGEVQLGLAGMNSTATVPIDLFIDDLVVDTSPLACAD